MKRGSGKALVVTKIEFRSSDDNAARLKRVFRLLLTPYQRCDGTDTHLDANQTKRRGDTDMNQH